VIFIFYNKKKKDTHCCLPDDLNSVDLKRGAENRREEREEKIRKKSNK
jgi:hypothetical protein